MALPTFKAAGTFTAGTGAITPPYPASPNAPVAGDIALLVCESENQAISLSSAQGFVELGAQANKAAGTAGTDPASRLAVYWKRCAGGDTAPTVADSGDHTSGRIYLFSGCLATGDPWNVYAEGNDGGANDTTGVIPGATTTVANCLIVLISTSSYNGTSTTEFSAWTNGDLANIVERGDNTNTAGYGGGHGLATGEKASAGAYGDTTVTLAHTSYKGAMSIALKPQVGYTLTAESGSFSFTGMAASLLMSFVLTAATGSFAFNSTTAGLLYHHVLAAESANYPETGTAGDLLKASALSAEAGNFAFSGSSAGLLASRILNVESSNYPWTGTPAGLNFGFTLAADSGPYAWTGSDADLLKANVLTVEAGAYDFAGSNADLLWARVLAPESGAYGWAGSDVNLLKANVLAAEAGTYDFAGSNADLLAARVSEPESGSYAWLGSAAELLTQRVLTVDSGNYPWTGNSADLIYVPIEGAMLFAESGNYGWEGTPAELLKSGVLEAAAGNYSFVGGSANLWRPQVPEKGFSLPGRAKGTGLGKRPKGWETPPRKKGF
jgi:hypothetical protein